jgi:hypothetical protein
MTLLKKKKKQGKKTSRKAQNKTADPITAKCNSSYTMGQGCLKVKDTSRLMKNYQKVHNCFWYRVLDIFPNNVIVWFQQQFCDCNFNRLILWMAFWRPQDSWGLTKHKNILVRKKCIVHRLVRASIWDNIPLLNESYFDQRIPCSEQVHCMTCLLNFL